MEQTVHSDAPGTIRNRRIRQPSATSSRRIIRQLSPGTYSYLLLSQRSLRKIEQITREEMNAIGGQEVLFPVSLPAEWQTEQHGPRSFPTGEELATAIARGELRSYRQLPQIWYQVQTTFRHSTRPASEHPYAPQSIVNASYSFDLDQDLHDQTYRKHDDAYCRIFDRCGLSYFVADADSNTRSAGQSPEFVAASPAGGNTVVARCNHCGYAAELRIATSRASIPDNPDPEGNLNPEEFHTPGFKTIAEVSAFTGLPETSQMKSLVVVAGGKPFLVMLRGDHQMNEAKLASIVNAADLRPALAHELFQWFGASAGSLGPVGVKNMRVLADEALRGRRNMIAGANKDEYHLKNVTPGEDFSPEFFHLRQVIEGDLCARCGNRLNLVKTTTLARLCKLGNTYSAPMALRILAQDGKEVAPLMASCEIDIERVFVCAVGLFHDNDGIALPVTIAPFTAVITPVNYASPRQEEAADRLYREMQNAGIDALLDDREERPGVKFKDADLIGIPYRVTIGKKLNEGKVDFVGRHNRRSEEIPVQDILAHLQSKLTPPFSALAPAQRT